MDLSPYLKTKALGRKLLWFDSIGSTNQEAHRFTTDAANHGLVIAADSQTAGRGRMTRLWHSPAGLNIYASILIFPQVRPEAVPQFALVMALALHAALHELFPKTPFSLKWPNDIWTSEQRKISGILCEAVFCGTQCSIIAGIGINVNGTMKDLPPELQNTAGTIFEATGQHIPREQLMAVFLNQLEPLFETWQIAQNLQPFMKTWQQADCLANTQISVCQKDEIISGTACGIREDGRLILSVNGQQIPIAAGDTHILRT